MTESKTQIDIIDPIMENDLGDYKPYEDEYAPKTFSRIEGLIYQWSLNTCFEQRVYIRELAEFLHDNLLDKRVQLGPVVYEREDDFEEEE